jgi:predicted GIY-YIG superfamily endonuclease
MFYVYLLASKPSGTLYAGLTTEPARRVCSTRHSGQPAGLWRFAAGTAIVAAAEREGWHADKDDFDR